jgi:pyrroloquinoline-quinone synthase
MTATTTLRARVDAVLERRTLLDHPFYRDWTAGTLTAERLQEYARQYFHFEAAFPRWLSAIHTRVEDPALRQLVLENLWDEEHGERNHRALWLEFAEALGVPAAEAEHSVPNEETTALVEHFETAAREGSIAAAMATLFAYEGQVPAVAAEKIRGLEEHYELTADQYEFFTVHLEADVAHSDAEVRALESLQAGDDEIVEAIEAACDRLHAFLDGCYAAAA